MRTIAVQDIIEPVRTMCIAANTRLGPDVLHALEHARQTEESPIGRDILSQLMENARIAQDTGMPLCQDTGTTVIFADIGEDVVFTGGSVKDALEEGVRQGYRDGWLRNSMVTHPITAPRNSGDNTPPVIHFDLVKGDRVTISVLPKGGGAENMSAVTMLKPAGGIDGITRFILDTVEQAGANPCPPVILGIGIGGTFEYTALMAKKALLRSIGERNPDPELARLEQEWLAAVNRLGIGPAGLGGTITALDVFVEEFPRHIASLPVAINIQCHAARHKTVVI